MALSRGIYPILQNVKKAGLSYDEAQLPLLMRAAYGGAPPKLIVMLRHPIDRLHASYYALAHYHGKYGNKADVRCMAACPCALPST